SLHWQLCSRVIFFFSSRRRHTRFSRDWSSYVCSCDLEQHHGGAARRHGERVAHPLRRALREIAGGQHGGDRGKRARLLRHGLGQDRKSVVKGKSVVLGGRRRIKK